MLSARHASFDQVRLARSVGLHAEGQEPVAPHDLRHSFVPGAFDHGDERQVADAARRANANVDALGRTFLLVSRSKRGGIKSGKEVCHEGHEPGFTWHRS